MENLTETRVREIIDTARFEKYYLYYGEEIDLLRVVDGDTYDFRITVDVGFNAKISIEKRFRILDINTPEIYGTKKESEEYRKGNMIKKSVEEKLKEKNDNNELVIRTFKRGSFGRYLCNIWYFEGKNIKNFKDYIKEELNRIEEEVSG